MRSWEKYLLCALVGGITSGAITWHFAERHFAVKEREEQGRGVVRGYAETRRPIRQDLNEDGRPDFLFGDPRFGNYELLISRPDGKYERAIFVRNDKDPDNPWFETESGRKFGIFGNEIK